MEPRASGPERDGQHGNLSRKLKRGDLIKQDRKVGGKAGFLERGLPDPGLRIIGDSTV